MRLGIGSYAYAWSIGVPGCVPPKPMTALDLLEQAAELQVGVVQICDNLPLHALGDGEIEGLARQAQQRRVQIEVGTRGIQPEQLLEYLRLAGRLQSAIVRVVVDTADHRPEADEVMAMLRSVLPQFERAGVCLAIENHDRFAARQLRDIVQGLDSAQVGICLDTVNSFGALEGPQIVVAILAPWVVSLHVKDFCVRRVENQMGFRIEGCPAGRGRLDVPWIIAQLQAAGRDPNAILEQWPPPEDTIEATIAKEDRWAKQSVAYLRTLIQD
jgi:sugar phosphate isomerase/epimerase